MSTNSLDIDVKQAENGWLALIKISTMRLLVLYPKKLRSIKIFKLSPMGYGMPQISFIKINRQPKFKQEDSICI